MSNKLLKLQFVALYVISVFIIGAIMAASWNSVPNVLKDRAAKQFTASEDVLYADNILHQQLNEWYDLLQKKATGDSSVDTEGALTADIAAAEEALRKSLQQLEVLQKQKKDPVEKATLSKMAATYNNAVVMYSKEGPVNMVANDGNSSEDIAKLINDIKQRDLRIVELEGTVAAARNATPAVITNSPPEIAKLLAQIESLTKQNGTLNRTVTTQKQSIDKMSRQIEAFRRFNEDQ